VKLCVNLWCLGAYFTAIVSDFHSSAACSLQLAFVALKIVRSLISLVEVVAMLSLIYLFIYLCIYLLFHCNWGTTQNEERDRYIQ